MRSSFLGTGKVYCVTYIRCVLIVAIHTVYSSYLTMASTLYIRLSLEFQMYIYIRLEFHSTVPVMYCAHIPGDIIRKWRQELGAMRMIGGMSEAVLRWKELSKGTQLKVVNAMTMPSLLYACEVWNVTKQQKSRMQATQMNVLRKIRVSRIERMRNEDIGLQLRQEGI